jgi:sirohydrochlorin ferrochelatase
MEPAPARARHEAIDYGDLLVHEWRVTRLTQLGIPWSLAQAVADQVDWHQVAKLVRRGCPPRIALQIVR